MNGKIPDSAVTGQKTDTEKSIIATAKSEWHLLPRALLAAVPFVGGPFSVLLEDHISRQRRQRLEDFVHALETQIGNEKHALEEISAEMLAMAAEKSMEHSEKWKPKVLAKIISDFRTDRDKLFRELLLDHTSQLTNLDLATFLDVAPSTDDLFPPEARDAIRELERDRPEIRQLRDVSLHKIDRLGFIHRSDTPGEPHAITELGAALLKALV